jgi:hypothetical protein
MIAVDTSLLVCAHREDSPFEAWFELPSLILLAETEGYWPELRAALEQSRISGPQMHDARVAAIMAFASCELPITASAAARHSTSSIRLWGEDRRRWTKRCA